MRTFWRYSHLTPRQRCPVCGHLLDRAGGEVGGPREGDLTVCCGCGAPLMFGLGLLLVRAPLEELDSETRSFLLGLSAVVKAASETLNRRF